MMHNANARAQGVRITSVTMPAYADSVEVTIRGEAFLLLNDGMLIRDAVKHVESVLSVSVAERVVSRVA